MHLRKPGPTADRHGELVARALAYAETHLDEPLTADTLADRAAMSRHHFHRVFRAYIGCSVANYVTALRIRRACALLVSSEQPIAEIALSVGYESSQALAKAMRRDLDTTPTAIRQGGIPEWKNLRIGRALRLFVAYEGDTGMEPTRFTEVPADLVVLTATAKGMVNSTMTDAAQHAFGELFAAVGRAGMQSRVATCMSLSPDDPQGPDDPDCRFVAGVVFGYSLPDGNGACEQPDGIELSGSVAWQPIRSGRCAVFTHIGPFTTLHRTWHAIYRDWLPRSGARLRDAPPMEINISRPDITPSAEMRTEIWIPVA